MRLSAIVLFFSLLVAVSYSAPASLETDEKKVEVKEDVVVDADVVTTTLRSIADSKEELADSTDAIKEEATTLASTRDGRQINENDDASTEDDPEDDDDDDEDEEEEEEEEEEAARNQVVKTPAVKKTGGKKKAAEAKPVPVLGEGGVEDDEAEDLGIFERDDVKSDEKTSDEKESDEEQKDDEKEESQEDESAEEEERDDPSGPTGLVAEPGSSERQDVDDTPVPPPGQNELVEPPLAIAVVQEESESNVPVVPVIVEDSAPANADRETAESKTETTRKNKPKKEKDEDDDDDEEEEDEDEEEEEEEAARSEKVSRSTGGENVLYYYPYPASPVIPQVTEEFY